MSRIVSPHPKAKIMIEIDKGTGLTEMKFSEPLPFEMVVQTLSALITSTTQERIIKMKALGVGGDPVGGDGKSQTENPFENPAVNPGGNHA